MPFPNSITAPIQALTIHALARLRARRSVLRELADHIEDRRDSLVHEQGLPPGEAYAAAVRAFGNPRAVATQLERIRNQGSWLDVALGAIPSLIVSFLFATHRWYEREWIIGAALLAMVISSLGVFLFSGRAWVYSWLSYALFPVLLVGVVSLATTGYAAWSVLEGSHVARDPASWVLSIGLGLAGVGVMITLLVWLSKKDWIHGMLVVLPITLLAVALLVFDQGAYDTITQAGTHNAILFGAFAFVVAATIRMGDRLLKIGVLATALPLAFLIISNGMDISIRIAVTVLVSLPALLLIIAPLVVSIHDAEADERFEPDAQRQ